MKELVLALMVIADGSGSSFQLLLEKKLLECEQRKRNTCVFTIEEDPVEIQPVNLGSQCKTIKGKWVCPA